MIKHPMPCGKAVVEQAMTLYSEWIVTLDPKRMDNKSISVPYGKHFTIQLGIMSISDLRRRRYNRLCLCFYQTGNLDHGWTKFYKICNNLELLNDIRI